MIYVKKIQFIFISILIYCGSPINISAQEKDTLASVTLPVKPKAKPLGDLKIKFNEEGTKFIKFGFGNQTWVRLIENNPGTAVDGKPQKETYDAGIRRMRISATVQLSPRYLMYVQMGINNQSFISGGGSGTGANGAGKKATFFFLDAYNEFTILPTINEATKTNTFNLFGGFGLHAWNGVSRLTNISSFRMLTADTPIFNFNTIEVSDQFARQIGVFLHGELGRLAYRINANKPFATNNAPVIAGPAVDNNASGKLSFAGYFDYQFFDKDNRTGSFLPSTYLGEKKMFNIGAGFYSNHQGTQTQPAEGVFKNHNIAIFGADVFLELPVGVREKQMSVSFYSVYYDYNFGPDYLRTTGIMNPGTADPEFTGTIAKEGFGNARFLLGTGNIWYTQAGFLLPKFSDKIRIQPYATYTIKNLDALAQNGTYYDLGTNLLLDGHNAKISLQYGSRPLYNGETERVFKRAGEFLACVQIYL